MWECGSPGQCGATGNQRSGIVQAPCTRGPRRDRHRQAGSAPGSLVLAHVVYWVERLLWLISLWKIRVQPSCPPRCPGRMATDTLVSRFSFSSLLAALLAGCAGADAVPLAGADPRMAVGVEPGRGLCPRGR